MAKTAVAPKSGRFIAVCFGSDEHPSGPLDHACPDVAPIAQLLGSTFEVIPLKNPSLAQVRDVFDDLGQGDDRPLVLMWSGHAQGENARFKLLAEDREVDLGYVVEKCAESGTGQLLIVLDTCFSGGGVPRAVDLAAAVFAERPPEADHVWVGVLASCRAADTARDGDFGSRFVKVLAEGPADRELGRPWAVQNRLLSGHHVCDALLKEWDSEEQRPVYRADGSSWYMLPNPKYDPAAPEQVVEHLLLAARSGATGVPPSWFTGRTVEVDTVVGWVRSGEPGVRVVTGSAGTGKSAIVGRIVSVSNTHERARVLGTTGPLGHGDPGEGSVTAHAHARGRTADQVAELIDASLVSRGVLPPDESGRRNAAQLVGSVQKALESEEVEPPVVVVDGLDEARSQAFPIARDLLVRLAPFAVVIVSTRDLSDPDEPQGTLIQTLDPDAAIDLDAPECVESGRTAIGDYVAARLRGVGAAMDAGLVADHVAAQDAEHAFLLARLVADQLRASPIDTEAPGWQQLVAGSIDEAFDADLERVPAPTHRALPDSMTASPFVRHLLAALTWAHGSGFPEEEWRTVATALAADPGIGEVNASDVTWALDQAGRYVVQDGEAGVAVYRVAHQTLADHLRPRFVPTAEQPFDPDALPVARALLRHYRTLLEDGVPARGPVYLWRYAWQHAAAAGDEGLALLRDVASITEDLCWDVALAATHLADTFGHWGRHHDSLAPTEESVTLYRRLAQDNAAHLPDLAGGLNNLGTHHANLGHHHDALQATRDAVTIRRPLAHANPAVLPALASALTNLGNRHANLGHHHDALQATRDAVTIRRPLAHANPAVLPALASALTNLGTHCTKLDKAELGEQAWDDVVDEAALPAGAVLLLLRARYRAQGDPATASWLADALGHTQDGGLIVALRAEVRRHRGPDPGGFDAAWSEHTGDPLPAWAGIDQALVDLATGWVDTTTYEAEHEYLLAHPELLDAMMGPAVEEALLPLTTETADRHRALRVAARESDIDTAYRPLLLGLLAGRFLQATPEVQRDLLHERRADLLDEVVLQTLAAEQAESDTRPRLRARALLHLASHPDAHTLLDAAFDALDDRDRFPDLLRETARGTPSALGVMSALAYSAATTPQRAGDALLHRAVAAALDGNPDQAATMARQAADFDPANREAWIRELADLAAGQPALAALIPHLLGPDDPTGGRQEP